MEYAQMTGMILLLGLMLYANGNDVFRSFFGGDDEPKKNCWEQISENIKPNPPTIISPPQNVDSNKLNVIAEDSILMDTLNPDS